MFKQVASVLLAALVNVLAFSALAQEHRQPLPCGLAPMTQMLLQKHPGYAQQLQMLDQQLYNASISDEISQRQQSLRVIPVVVHIIHDYGVSNITREQVHDALRILNEDFNYGASDTMLVEPSFKSLMADVKIEFRLAKLDPDGNCTDGITRTFSTLTNSANDNVKDIIRWDTDKYLNIWVVGGISLGVSAYAYLPCTFPDLDGIVINHAFLGSTGTSTLPGWHRALSHEVGHYLGLKHTWSANLQALPGDTANCHSDDGIADTPNTIGVAGFTCNLGMVSCGNLSNVQNIMDYASCMTMFTHGQKAVMRNALNLPCRINLGTENNLMATGTSIFYVAPICAAVPDFRANKTRICRGESIQFTDLSYNAPVDASWTWSWLFPGATPSTSTAQHPQVVYNTTGQHPVSLFVTNAGGTNVITRTEYIDVRALNTGIVAPVHESFEDPTFPYHHTDAIKDWELVYSSFHTWETTSSASFNQMYSLFIKHGIIPAGSVNEIISPNIDLSQLISPEVHFRVAYAQRPGTTTNDRLRVLFSADCGQTWVLRYGKAGTTLATAAPTGTDFVPASGEWRKESIVLPANLSSRVMIKFESTSGNGNTLYIDDLSIESGPSSAPKEVLSSGLALYPNPNPDKGRAAVAYELRHEASTRLVVIDALGREVASVARHEPQGRHEHQLQAITGPLAPGVYFVRLQTDAHVYTRKLIVH